MKSLAKNSVYNALYQILNLIFPLIASIYVARTLMPDGVGRVAYAQNMASYFTMAAALGVPTVGMRVISIARNDRQKLNKAFSELIILGAVSTTIALILYLILVFFTPKFSSDLYLYLASGLVVAFNYINIDWLYQGCEEYQYIVLRNIGTKILSLLALFLFVKNKDDYVLYALITSLATCGNYVFNILHARRFASLQFHNLDPKQHVRPILILAVTMIFSSIYSKIDTTMLGVISGERYVGYYSYAHKVLLIGVGVCTAITSAFLPRLSYYFQNDQERFRELVVKGTQIVSFLTFPASVGMFLLAPEAVEILFGQDFLPAAVTLRYFSIMILIFGFGNLLCYQMMICSGNEKLLVPVYAVASCINIALNSVLIPKMHHNGAALASVCTELFINGVECVYTSKKLRLKYDWKAIKQAVFSSAIMAMCILCVKQLIHSTSLQFVIGVALGIIAYCLTNLLIHNELSMQMKRFMKIRLYEIGVLKKEKK